MQLLIQQGAWNSETFESLKLGENSDAMQILVLNSKLVMWFMNRLREMFFSISFNSA